MDSRNLKTQAAAAVADSPYNMRTLALLHTGVTVLFSLLFSILTWLLDRGMTDAVGIGGLALRSALESAQLILSLGGNLALPFWQIGFLYAALQCCRREVPGPGSLLHGFRRFGPVLRLNLLAVAIVMAVIFASSYVSSAIFMFTPLAEGMLESMEVLLVNNPQADILDLLPNAQWLLLLNLVVMLAVGLPLYYRFRLCEYALMNGAVGAVPALRLSAALTRRRKMALFRLDLSFWWYYLLQFLVSALAYSDLLLGALELSGPWLFWVSLLLSSAGTLLVAWLFSAHYHTTWACCYRELTELPSIQDN